VQSLHFLKVLGAGAMGSVYLAEMVSGHNFRRQIAVKIIKNEAQDAAPFISRMRDEARLLGLLQDDEILQVLNLVHIQGRDAILMEYVEGTDLAKIAGNNISISPKAIATLGAISAGVLHRAHTAVDPRTRLPLNVVHRDIKPANIMITKNGGVKICDFGVAKARFEGQESRTSPDQILGTLQYMSPEYLRTGEISPAADVLALGLTIVELLSGHKFGRPKLKKMEHEQVIEKLFASSRLPNNLTTILKQCLAWDPQHRPSAARLEDELYNVAESLPGLSLRRWAAKVVPQLEHSQASGVDQLNLLGQTITMTEHAFTMENTLDVPPNNDILSPSSMSLSKSPAQEDESTPNAKNYDTLIGVGLGIVLFLFTLPLYLL
jgi:serine/threonine-protein kinase